MLKRKYADRSDWNRVVERGYAQAFIEDDVFTGYITLLRIDKVTAPLFVKAGNQEVCIVDKGYTWLQQLPAGKAYAVTTMFNGAGEIVQWYIDICKATGVDEKQIPWFDDLYLDITVLPTGELFVLDADELEEALHRHAVSQDDYDHAWQVTNELTNAIKTGDFKPLKLSRQHRNLLLNRL